MTGDEDAGDDDSGVDNDSGDDNDNTMTLVLTLMTMMTLVLTLMMTMTLVLTMMVNVVEDDDDDFDTTKVCQSGVIPIDLRADKWVTM